MYAGDALPGLRVEIAPAPAPEALERMDVAVFAGFAERGPCHVAIPISSVAAYAALFGGDCPLAWDGQAGERLSGNLGPSVRAFFSNGGTRCWVIRVAETEVLAAARAAETGAADPGSRPAVAGRFPMTGLLRAMPDAGAGGSRIEPAVLRASSLGSWSDSMRLAARVSRHPVPLQDVGAVPFGLSFADPGLLAAGDLLELGGVDATRCYAKVLRVGAGKAWAMWIAAFAPPDPGTPPEAGQADMNGGSPLPAMLGGGGSSIAFTAPGTVPELARGRWIRFRGGGSTLWLMPDQVEGAVARGRAWQEIVPALPQAPLAAAGVTLDIAEHRPGGERVHAGFGPAPEAANALHALVDLDSFYADPARRSAAIRPGFAVDGSEFPAVTPGADPFETVAARFGTAGFTAADRIAVGSAWLPIGLVAGFGEMAAPFASADDPLVRDGLSRFDERLFLDPRLETLRGPAIAARLALAEGREAPPLGIHAALDIAGDLFPEATLLAVPDAAQPGWEIAAADAAPLPPQPGAPERPNWRDHAGACLPRAKAPPLSAPDWSGFLDCTTQLLPAPALTVPAGPVAADEFTLSWAPQPKGTLVVLEESADPAFAAATELLRALDASSYRVTGRTEGTFYYRLWVERGGNMSPYSAGAVTVRKARYAAKAVADAAHLPAIHAAMLRLAAAEAGFFALLSLPRTFRGAEAAAYAARIGSLAPGAGDAGHLGADEARLLSYGAIYHPWLVSGTEDALVASPPDGAVAGTIAARTARRGAWVAPANAPLADVVGLDPDIAAADLLPLDRARVNLVRRLPAGFAVQDADTLSTEAEWRPINVRRLMMLLRRTMTRRGLTHVFEPNGPVLRRAVERSLTALLDDMQLRGAFAGRSSADSFRVALQPPEADADAGRLVVEVAVAPSQPLRFLTLRLVQQGARLSIAEEA